MLSSILINFIYILIPFIVCSLGFYKFVYFVSVGYGLSVSILSIWLMTMFAENLTFISWIIGLNLILHGFILGGYVYYREVTSTTYRKSISQLYEKVRPIHVRLLTWIFCALLYDIMDIPYYYILNNNKEIGPITVIGTLIQVVGQIVETVADYQKYREKKINPKRFVDTGLYKIVRCPNYLGEILFWSGIFISGFGHYIGFFQFILSFLGWLCITFVMLHSTRDIEKKQNQNYGVLPEYQKYIKEVPILFPFIPIYSFVKF